MTLIPLTYAKKTGINYGVLEANRESERTYRNLGFKEYCKFDIYWKVGKQFI